MRVLQVARHGSVRGGAETYVRSLSHGLREAGHEVALVYGTEPDLSLPEVRAGLQVEALASTERPAEGSLAALSRAIEQMEPDVIHVHVADLAWVAPLCASRAPTLLAVHDHVLDSPTGTRYWAGWHKQCTITPGVRCLAFNVVAHCGSLRANATLRPYKRWRAANAAARTMRIQVFSPYMREAVARAGVDDAAVTPYPVPPLADPIAPHENDARPVILASGRLNKEKGFRQLLGALSRVTSASHLVIAGSGHDRDALEAIARRIYGPHRVTFTGWLSPEDLAGWIERAAIVAMPSMWPEPFGIAGLEAMARARPVVAFDSGGIATWLADGETGVLVPVGDEIALAGAIERLLRDPDARARMGAAGRARAEHEFNLGDHVARVLELYRQVAA